MKDRQNRNDRYDYEEEERRQEEHNALMDVEEFGEYDEWPYRNGRYSKKGDFYQDVNEGSDDDYDEEEYSRAFQKKKKGYEGSQLLIILQLSVCVFILAVVFILKMFGGNAYTMFREWYQTELNKTVIATDGIQEYRDKLFSSGEASESENDSKKPPESSAENIEKEQEDEASANEKSAKKVSEPTKQAAAMSYVTIQNAWATSQVMLSVPLSAPLEEGVVSSAFGYRKDPTEGGEEIHKGLDIAAEEGTMIYSALPGVVKKAEKSNSYGNYVVIDHGNEIFTLYAHCSKLLVKEGDTVERGDSIAQVGSTGDATGSHLHFELRIQDSCYDPQPLLKGKYSS